MLIEVNVNTIRQNIRKIRCLTQCQICGVVKANAYGHGLALAKYISDEVDCFAVATVAEALCLRQLSIFKPIMVLGVAIGEDIVLAKDNDIILTIANINNLNCIIQQTQGTNLTLAVDIKINTGMNRIGFEPNQLGHVLSSINQSKHLTLHGIYSHLSHAKDNDYTNKQLASFINCCNQCPITVSKHISATNCTQILPEYHFDVVRLGIGMYGYGDNCVEPALTASGYVVQINDIQSGDFVGYNSNYCAIGDKKIATINIGYGDGVNRLLSNCGQIAINENLYPIVGNICMDMLMVDITNDNTDIKFGDRAYYISNLSNCDDIARLVGTIPYEILTNISLRSKYNYRT